MDIKYSICLICSDIIDYTFIWIISQTFSIFSDRELDSKIQNTKLVRTKRLARLNFDWID